VQTLTRRIISDEIERLVEHLNVGGDDPHLSVCSYELIECFTASRMSGEFLAFSKIVARMQAAVVIEAAFYPFDKRQDFVGKIGKGRHSCCKDVDERVSGHGKDVRWTRDCALNRFQNNESRWDHKTTIRATLALVLISL
jgi:hypothetical protein